ncbi:oligoendopeptidase F [Peptostreptococcus equinus]|uniref:Oligopeptidase F n=1 Tax=Peptostreptococcus equinus TaxID=3003601 RepID=A0ABY7JQ84_9FIRM|nr:oligoendopeptidase F [Peptostreptococcus sp. CBA3647]WAW15319.1 oligoendopeptidase F [Peptostreptococcus sp. CBA3647]
MAKDRKTIEDKFKWNLEEMYSGSKNIESDLKYIKKNIEEIKNYKGKLSDSADNLYIVMKLMEECSRKLSHYYVYTHMKHHEDTRINENLGEATKSEMLSTDLDKATSYVVPEILEMDEKKLDEYLKEKRLLKYRKMIDEILRDKPYILSEKEEQIMAQVSDLTGVPENAYEMLSYADMKFPEITDEEGNKVELNHFNYNKFIKSADRRVRKEAFEAEFGTYKKYSNTFAATLFGAIKAEIFNANIRKYPSALYASLFADNINIEVYENLITSVSENIPALNKYLNVKKKYLGLDKMHMYDLYQPMAKDFKMEISYEKAQEIIINALEPIGSEYQDLIKKAFSQGWIDVYENEGKKGGAYSWGSYDSHPYILMSYNNDLNSMFTLIHELGHSIHSYYSRNNQEYIYSSYKIFVAEVASTVNETLLIKYLLKNSTSREEKIYLLNYYLEQFRTTVYRQTLFAEFEKICHEKVEKGQPMTAMDFSKVYFELNQKYYGGACEVDQISEVEWARIPHFYSNFYVYKYATGFSAASVLSSLILDSRENVDRYIEFLKSGGSEYPLDQLKKAGIDMSKKDAVDNALKEFAKLVDELDSII